MKLLFLGRGAGFNPAEGSTAAYFLENKKLFLIDAGESVFRSLLERKILDQASEINIFITHTHSDHTGSLGSLILYASMVKKQPVHIIIDDAVSYSGNISALLTIFGLTSGMYRFVDASVFDNTCSSFTKVRYVKTRHCGELDSCGIRFETSQGIVFYSGDMRDSDPLVELIRSGQAISAIYVDSNNDREPNIHHLSVHALNDLIPLEIKPKIHCMHMNNRQCMADAKNYGFAVVSCSEAESP